LRVAPTALGWKSTGFLAVVTFVYFAAPYSNLFFLLLAFAFVLGATNAVSAVRNMAGVRGCVETIEPVAAGAPLRVVARVESNGRARFDTAVEIAIDGQRAQVAGCAAVCGGGTVEGFLPPLARGVYTVRRARLVSAWPLGLMRAAVGLDAPRDVVVYPAPLGLSEAKSLGGAGGDDGMTSPAAGMLQPSSLREYRAGDSLKRVHWRAMARRNRPVVTEWEGGQGEGFEFVLDRRASEDEFEHALAFLVTVAQQARSQGKRPWDALWRFLAAAQALEPDAGPPPPAGPNVPRVPQSVGGAV